MIRIALAALAALLLPLGAAAQTAVATFAGGCFWCMEPPYDKLPGVISTMSGYMGGTVKNPTYEQVSERAHRPHGGGAGHLRPGQGHATRSCSRCSGRTSTRR